MISITTAYFNRKKLFYNTLKSIERSSYKDIEFIAVDDGSNEEERIEDFEKEFPFLKVIRVEPESKNYINPCVPFNKAIRAARGEVIILQNPECLHLDDALTYVSENIDENIYLTCGVYAIDRDKTFQIDGMVEKKDILEVVGEFENKATAGQNDNGWYNHPKVRPAAYHFFSAITKSNMDQLNGFDERYAHGIAYDDDEILARIRRMRLKVQVHNPPRIIHQWHYGPNNYGEQASKNLNLLNRNANLYMRTTLREKSVRVN